MAGKILKDALGALKSVTDEAEQRSFGAMVPDDEVSKLPSGDIVVKAMANDDLMALNEALEKSGFQQGLNLGRIGEIFNDAGDGAFNVERVLTNIKENNKELFQQMRRETQSMDALMAMAKKTGYDQIVFNFLGRKPGQVKPPEDVLAGLAVVIKLGRELRQGAEQAMGMDEQAKLEAFKRLRVMATVQSNLAAQVAGNVSEYGRGLSVVSNISKLEGLNLGSYAAQLDEFVQDMDEGLVDYHLNTFLTLQNPAQRAKYAESGWAQKSYDFAMEQYINALLSSPVTHVVNMAGNASFQVLSLAERGLAGMIGNIRTLGGMRGEIGDQRYMSEAAAEAYGLMMAQKDAVLLMSKTFITGGSADPVTKIDLRNRRALGGTDNLADVASSINQGDYSKAAIDALGIATRLPGRFLASEDEYFKVITMRRVLYREAHRAMQTSFQQARRAGMSREEAKALAESKYVQVMSNTPKDVKDMMTTEARKMTFQGKPDGFFGRVGPLISNIPGMKFIVPFYNTPTNIINEVFDRTANWSPVYRAIKAKLPGGEMMPGGAAPSGAELDDALAKLAIGNATAFTIYGLVGGDYGDDVIVTGRLGREFSTAQNISGSAKVPPYSIGLKQDDGSYRFASFTRFDPLSAILAMGADMKEYMRYEDDPSIIASLSKAYTLSVVEYATQLPFLQGVSELVAAAGGSYQTKEDFFERMSAWAGGVVGTAGTNVIGNVDRAMFGLPSYAANYLSDGQYPLISQNSFMATIERVEDPYASSTKLPPGTTPELLGGDLYTEAPMFLQGFYTALQKAKARNPYFSADLPDKLDFWGRSKTQGEGRRDELYNPVRIQTGQYNDLDQELIRLSETGIGTFPFHRDRVDGIKLNNLQFNDYVYLINNVDDNGRMMGDIGFDNEKTLLPALLKKVNSVEYTTLRTDEEKFEELSSILTDRRSSARDMLIKTDPDLNARVSLEEMTNQ